MYVPGTLNVVTVPAGGDASNTNPSGGVNNSGLVDIRNLSLGGLGTFIVVEYDVRTAPALPNQSYVQNQAQVYISGARSRAQRRPERRRDRAGSAGARR